jgi:hypothetical protein
MINSQNIMLPIYLKEEIPFLISIKVIPMVIYMLVPKIAHKVLVRERKYF